MALHIRDDKKAFEKLKRSVDKLKDKPAVKVGVQGADADKTYTDGNVALTTVVDIATWNEFGTATIPQRSFLRDTIDLNRKKYLSITDKLKSRVIRGQDSAEFALSILGQKIRDDIIRRIKAGIEPPNAPSTVARKGSSKPLIDTGQLWQSITYVIVNGGGET